MWTAFAAEIIQKIRRFDPNHAIILEPSPGAMPEAFDYIEHAITDRNVVYSVHMYEPHALTHQGISSFRSFTYPGVSLSLGYWGKRKIAAALEPVRRFAARNGYTKERAGRVWNILYYTEQYQPEEHQGLPAIRYLGFAGQPPYGDSDERVLDLRSVHERLVASGFRHEVWRRATTADIKFLVQLVHEYVQLG